LNNLTKNLLLWLVIAVVLMSVVSNLSQRQAAPKAIEYSQFVREVHDGKVAQVTIQGNNITGQYQDKGTFKTYAPNDPKLVDDLFLRASPSCSPF
jgi:cell division protease FtsH